MATSTSKYPQSGRPSISVEIWEGDRQCAGLPRRRPITLAGIPDNYISPFFANPKGDGAYSSDDDPGCISDGVPIKHAKYKAYLDRKVAQREATCRRVHNVAHASAIYLSREVNHMTPKPSSCTNDALRRDNHSSARRRVRTDPDIGSAERFSNAPPPGSIALGFLLPIPNALYVPSEGISKRESVSSRRKSRSHAGNSVTRSEHDGEEVSMYSYTTSSNRLSNNSSRNLGIEPPTTLPRSRKSSVISSMVAGFFKRRRTTRDASASTPTTRRGAILGQAPDEGISDPNKRRSERFRLTVKKIFSRAS